MTIIQKNLNINSPAFIPATGGSSTCSSSPPSPSPSPAPPPYLAHLYPPLPSPSTAPSPPSPPTTLHLKDFRVKILAHPSGALDDARVDLHLSSATLPALRDALLSSPIAAPSRDVFFPSWTTSVRVSYASHPDQPLHLIDTDAALVALAADHASRPGDVSLRLEQCHQPKYSRFPAADPKPSPSKPRIPRRASHHCIDGPTTVATSIDPAHTRTPFFEQPYQMMPTNILYLPVHYPHQPWHHPVYTHYPPGTYFGGVPNFACADRSPHMPYPTPWGLALKTVNIDNCGMPY